MRIDPIHRALYAAYAAITLVGWSTAVWLTWRHAEGDIRFYAIAGLTLASASLIRDIRRTARREGMIPETQDQKEPPL